MPDPNPGLLTIVGEALECADPAARAAYLNRACGENAALRERVEALLAAHAGAGRFLEPDAPSPNPSAATGAFDAPRAAEGATADFGSDGATGTFGDTPTGREGSAPAELGTVIAGRYTLVEVIGEGGMGSVYRASQSEPVKRQVALKLIKTGMDSKGVLARFDAERQALALMDHPNIARVYDGGTTEKGQPFFVMELVKGVPLTDYCDQQRLSVTARLELFVQVCQAVQHAHQKGIIHRDLKPGNVLVTEVDGRPTPKVIDFGVAKATELKLTDLSFADAGSIVGTPAYMSPEQADPSSMDIDTRTDVYALGIMLYELLTGSPPIDAKQFRRGGVLEMLRMVREVDPPRPSTKLSVAADLPNVAANRNIEPAKLAKSLRGELDWVVMKAIEKDRTRRYDSANGLARDLERYLADEVVEARPPSAGYRLKKFVRRHKGQVIAASLILFALLAGIAGTTWGLFEAKRQEQEAKKQEKIARDEATEKEKSRAAEAEQVKQRDAALVREAERVQERDAALKREGERADELKHRLGISSMLLAGAAYDNRDVNLAAERLAQVPAELRGWDWRYLKQQTRGGLFTLYGHKGPVTCVGFSPDGTTGITPGVPCPRVSIRSAITPLPARRLVPSRTDMDRRDFVAATAGLAVTAGASAVPAAAAEEAVELTPLMEQARQAGLKALKPAAKELEHGLKLHAESLVFDAYGFAPRAALDTEALRKAFDAGASDAELQDVRAEMGMIRCTSDATERAEFETAWRAAGVTCIFQNAGEEGQDPLRLLKRLARFTFVTDALRGFVSKAAAPDDIETAKKARKHCLYLTGNGVPLAQQWATTEDELKHVRVFFQLGIRMTASSLPQRITTRCWNCATTAT